LLDAQEGSRAGCLARAAAQRGNIDAAREHLRTAETLMASAPHTVDERDRIDAHQTRAVLDPSTLTIRH
jgi:hypothetical protein